MAPICRGHSTDRSRMLTCSCNNAPRQGQQVGQPEFGQQALATPPISETGIPASFQFGSLMYARADTQHGSSYSSQNSLRLQGMLLQYALSPILRAEPAAPELRNHGNLLPEGALMILAADGICHHFDCHLPHFVDGRLVHLCIVPWSSAMVDSSSSICAQGQAVITCRPW